MNLIDETPLAFGRHKGKTPTQVANEDAQYIVWMYENVKPTPCSKELAELCEMDVREEEAFGLDIMNDYFMKW